MSGFFAYRSVGKWTSEFTRSMLVRKFRAQVICTLIFFALLAYASGGDPLGWVESGFGGYWFTVVLFQMFLCYTLLSLLGRKCGEGFTIAGMALLSAAGLGVLVAPFPKEGWLWTLLCWENVAKYFQFFTLGIVCRKYEAAFCRACSSDRMKTLAIVAYVACMCLWYSDSFRAWNGVAYRMVHDVAARYAGLGMVVTLFTPPGVFPAQRRRGPGAGAGRPAHAGHLHASLPSLSRRLRSSADSWRPRGCCCCNCLCGAGALALHRRRVPVAERHAAVERLSVGLAFRHASGGAQDFRCLRQEPACRINSPADEKRAP